VISNAHLRYSRKDDRSQSEGKTEVKSRRGAALMRFADWPGKRIGLLEQQQANADKLPAA
jgi:hypothetical protein